MIRYIYSTGVHSGHEQILPSNVCVIYSLQRTTLLKRNVFDWSKFELKSSQIELGEGMGY